MSLGFALSLIVMCLALMAVPARAQVQGPDKELPMSLLVGRKDGVAYYDQRKQLGQLTVDGPLRRSRWSNSSFERLRGSVR